MKDKVMDALQRFSKAMFIPVLILPIAGILIAAWLWLGKRTLVTSVANSAPGRLLGS